MAIIRVKCVAKKSGSIASSVGLHAKHLFDLPGEVNSVLRLRDGNLAFCTGDSWGGSGVYLWDGQKRTILNDSPPLKLRYFYQRRCVMLLSYARYCKIHG